MGFWATKKAKLFLKQINKFLSFGPNHKPSKRPFLLDIKAHGLVLDTAQTKPTNYILIRKLIGITESTTRFLTQWNPLIP